MYCGRFLFYPHINENTNGNIKCISILSQNKIKDTCEIFRKMTHFGIAVRVVRRTGHSLNKKKTFPYYTRC